MLEVKKDRARGTQVDPTTAQYVDRMEREGLRQMERGEGRPLEEVLEDIRKKHRLPRVE